MGSILEKLAKIHLTITKNSFGVNLLGLYGGKRDLIGERFCTIKAES